MHDILTELMCDQQLSGIGKQVSLYMCEALMKIFKKKNFISMIMHWISLLGHLSHIIGVLQMCDQQLSGVGKLFKVWI